MEHATPGLHVTSGSLQRDNVYINDIEHVNGMACRLKVANPLKTFLPRPRKPLNLKLGTN